jgi:hypothetical protein
VTVVPSGSISITSADAAPATRNMNRPSHAAVSVLPVCIGTPPPHFVVSGNDSVGKVGRATRSRRESGAQSNANQHQLVSSLPERAAELSTKPKLEAESAEFAEVIRSV